MPLSVEIKINGSHIQTLHIGRDESLKSRNSTHHYTVTDKVRDWMNDDGPGYGDRPDWDAGVPFTHKYSEGALVCAQKAIDAFLKAT